MFTIHILAAVAEHEASLISSRTRAALAAARARGVVLRCPRQGIQNLRAHDGRELGVARIKALAQERAVGLVDILADIGPRSLHAIAQELNIRGIRTARGGRWHATTCKRLLARLDRKAAPAAERNYVQPIGAGPALQLQEVPL